MNYSKRATRKVCAVISVIIVVLLVFTAISAASVEPDSDSAEALRIVKHERYDNTKGRLEYE